MKKIVLFVIILTSILVGYSVCKIKYESPPYIDLEKKDASVFVLGCIDPRFINVLEWYLNSKNLKNDYDFFTLSGASLGVMQTKFPEWGVTFKNQLDLAIKLHNIDEIWVFDHLNCGMYKHIYNIEHDNIDLHKQNIDLLKSKLKDLYPTIKFKGHFIDTNGTIHNV
jgi:carbonic anhydrase